MTFDPVEFAKGIGDFIRSAIDKAMTALEPRLSALEARQVFTAQEVRQLIDSAIKEIPPAKEGPALEEVRGLVEEAVKALPTPEPGKNGTSVTAEDVLPALREQLADHIRSIPAPKNGKDGPSVEEVAEAILGPVEMEIGRRVERQVAAAVLDFERRAQDTLFRACERIPKPKDGMGFEDIEIAHDGERRFCFRLVRGDEVKEFPFRLPAVIYRQVFKEGTDYEQGDAVTFGGSLWIAEKDDPAGKPGLSDDWTLAAKKGRDGK